MDRELIKKKIQDYLKQHADQVLKQRALFKRLKLNEQHYRLFKSALEDLSKTGAIHQTGNHQYGLIRKQAHITGTLSVNSRGFGFVETGQAEDIFIGARSLRNALDGDLVRVELLPGKTGVNREGRITEVIHRNRTEFVGTFTMDRFGCWVTPNDKSFQRRFLVPFERTAGAKEGQVVLVEMGAWENADQEPVGQIKEVLGTPGDPGLDAISIIRTFQLPTRWSQAALAQAEGYTEKSIQAEIGQRNDLRHIDCFTIDPESAADFDDAVSIKKLDRGWRLGVYIADVSHYVTPNSAIDRGARERGTSVYLVDRAIHMLPEALASNLCSLKPDVDRLAMVCSMDLDQEGQVRQYQIEPAIIRSRKRFTYSQVQEILNGAEDQYADDLKLMDELRAVLYKRRKALGSVDIDLPEPKFKLDVAGFPVEIKASERLNSHRLIEEFMLLANQTVARHVEQLQDPPLPFVYRVHDIPQASDLERFRQILSRVGVPYRFGRIVKPIDFQKVVELVRESPYRHFIEKVALRSMTKAIYTTQNRGHFGLAFDSYTHFTSPIRRYPDLMVHRLLKKYRNSTGIKTAPKVNSLEKIAKYCSTRERVAVEAEREHIKIKQLQYMTHLVGQTFNGIISGVMHFGIFVELVDTFVEGLVHIRTLKDDWYEYVEQQFALIGRRTRKKFQLGDPVTIRIASVSVAERMADFELLDHKNQIVVKSNPVYPRKRHSR